jgi:N-succinyl-L-ornithine transcarbamylase
MPNYLRIADIDSPENWISQAIALKKAPRNHRHLGEGKTLGLLFFNNSLRTRLSTQKAAINLGLDVMLMNFGNEGWSLEYQDGTVMDQGAAEHIREAAQVVSQYCDIIGIRAFASLKDRKTDQAEEVLEGFRRFASVPLINLESSLGHPLQALADAITISENTRKSRPRIVLSWAPHPRPLPHAVANSFVQMMHLQKADFIITHPRGYELDPEITKHTPVEYDQEKALQGADFVYVKNWSSFADYGKVISTDPSWMMTIDKLGEAKFMHCLPVRRNVVVEDAVLDSPRSLIIEQANNRTYAAQTVLKRLLEK